MKSKNLISGISIVMAATFIMFVFPILAFLIMISLITNHDSTKGFFLMCYAVLPLLSGVLLIFFSILWDRESKKPLPNIQLKKILKIVILMSITMLILPGIYFTTIGSGVSSGEQAKLLDYAKNKYKGETFSIVDTGNYNNTGGADIDYIVLKPEKYPDVRFIVSDDKGYSASDADSSNQITDNYEVNVMRYNNNIKYTSIAQSELGTNSMAQVDQGDGGIYINIVTEDLDSNNIVLKGDKLYLIFKSSQKSGLETAIEIVHVNDISKCKNNFVIGQANGLIINSCIGENIPGPEFFYFSDKTNVANSSPEFISVGLANAAANKE